MEYTSGESGSVISHEITDILFAARCKIQRERVDRYEC